MLATKQRTEISFRVLLIATILFNVLTSTPVSASFGQGTKSNPEFGILGSALPKKAAPLLQSSDGWLVCDSVRRQTSNAIAGYCDPAYSEGTYIRGVITDHTSAGRYMAFHNTATIPSNTINFRFVVNGVVYSSYSQNSAYGRYMLTSSHSTGNMDDRWNLFGQGAAITYDVDRDYLDHTIAGQFLQNFDLAFRIDITYPANSTIYGYFEAWVGDYPIDDTGCAPDTFEPDNSLATGNPIIFGEVQRHSLCPQGDEDWVRVNLPSQLNLLAETFDLEPDDINPNGNTQLTVIDESENQIGTNLDRGFGPPPGSNIEIRSSRVVWHPSIGEIFNIRVFPEAPINEQTDSGYSLRLANPSWTVDPVDQASWGPTKVNVPVVFRSGNVIYFLQHFMYEQAQLDALNAVRATLAWEFRRPEVNTDTGEEIDESNVDYGDYWQNVDGECMGDFWTNLPTASDEFVEESNSVDCTPKYFNNPLAPDNEEFELYVDDPTQLIAGKVYYIMIKFYVHAEYLNSNYQFYISKAEYCQLYNIPETDLWVDIVCNIREPIDLADKLTANLIEGYLQPAP